MIFHKTEEPVSVQSFGLGTVIQLTASGKNARQALDASLVALDVLETKMSFFKENSDICRINAHAGGDFQPVDPKTYAVIQRAVRYSQQSGGALDLTVRPLTTLWETRSASGQIPEQDEIAQTLQLVNYQDIELDEARYAVRLHKPGQAIDLNCIAKGFAADLVREIMKKHHIRSALINLGGNIYGHGSKNYGLPWRIGIQHPDKPRGNFVGFFDIKNCSVVTSGNYEKFFAGNRKYHHIIHPRTGYPVTNRIASTTVISQASVDGDAATTCLYVLGIAKGLEWLKKLPGLSAVILTSDSKIYCTKNIGNKLQLTDNRFEWG